MPTRPLSRCTTPGCQGRTYSGKCPRCRTRQRRTSDHARGTPAQRGYGSEHRERFRAAVLGRDRWCVLCHRSPATVADHFPRSRRELVAAGLDPNDPQHGRGLCGDCDRRQTAERQPGGWNARR